MGELDISEETVRRVAQGDEAAFESMYRTFSGFVYRVSFRMLDNTTDAEEIVQDVFVQIFRQLGEFRFESSLKTWIYRITINTSLNFRKKRSSHRDRVKKYQENVSLLEQEERPCYTQEDDNKMQVAQLLKELNPEQRTCIILRNIEGLSYEEIAQTLEVNINTVRTRLKRAREKLIAIGQRAMNSELQ